MCCYGTFQILGSCGITELKVPCGFQTQNKTIGKIWSQNRQETITDLKPLQHMEYILLKAYCCIIEWGCFLPDLSVDRLISGLDMFSGYSSISANVISVNFTFLLSLAHTHTSFLFAWFLLYLVFIKKRAHVEESLQWFILWRQTTIRLNWVMYVLLAYLRNEVSSNAKTKKQIT